ncbi:serine/threonine-protein phosphatase 2A activator [Drosophila pseudoobscura]|uniref:Serine/threonine-protein phosphatase 2A activator n=1 Tax=Drosophila pseudoobscura pseudoobscura TaxID=46245 RepID=A0A6I8UQ13_DROPS|nr:serine/threonine-protein phosphatase 2A activator [Drosophila pseudoobscura]
MGDTCESKSKMAGKIRLMTEFCSQSSLGPEARIVKHQDVHLWEISQAYHELIAYINTVSTTIQGLRLSDSIPVSPAITRLAGIFDQLEAMIHNNPPIMVDNAASFASSIEQGNKAYRRWSRSMLRGIYPMVEKAVPASKCQYVNELGQYLSGSFGNATRIDYGTGHELSFLFFLCSLFRAQILQEDDVAASALVIFARYLKFVRRLQVIYTMESAGSHGAYSLDTFQFMPFLWGVAQLSYEAPFSPRQMLDADVVSRYRSEYLLIGSIGHVSDTKMGTFAMHSCQLWSLAALSSWTKIYRSLLFMYLNEVLAHFEIMQHIRFGKLMPFSEAALGRQMEHARLGVMSPLRRRQLELKLEEERRQQAPDQAQAPKKPAPKVAPPSPDFEDSESILSAGTTNTPLTDASVYLRSPSKDDVEAADKHL